MSLLATRLQDWRVSNPQLDKNMARPFEYGALDFFVGQTDAPNSIIGAELRERAFGSIGNTVTVPVIQYDSTVTVSNTRSCTVSDDENTSALYSVVWTTYSVGFTMTPAAYLNNEISYEQDFARKMDKVSRALANSLDTAAIASLEANKTQVFADALNYTVTSNVVKVGAPLASSIMGDINPMMRANAYPEQIHVIGNAGADSLIRKLAQHSIYNDVNKQLEWDGKVFHFTTNLTNASGDYASFYAVADGNVGVLTRVDREAYLGTVANGHEWSTTYMPYVNLPVGVHYYTAVGDQSTIAGDATADLTCAVKEYFGFSVDVAFIVAYNSAPSTIANPIIKAGIASPNTDPIANPVYVVNAADFQ